jgi:hypothetical protein
MRLDIEKFYGSFADKLTSEFLSRLDRNFERLARWRKLNVTVSAVDYTLVITDDVVVYTGAGGHTFTLPNAVAFVGYNFIVKNAGAGNLTINGGTLASGVGLHLYAANGAWQSIP